MKTKANEIKDHIHHFGDLDSEIYLTNDVIEDRNIGTKENPQIIKLSKKLSIKEKEEYINMMKKYTHVFSWS